MSAPAEGKNRDWHDEQDAGCGKLPWRPRSKRQRRHQHERKRNHQRDPAEGNDIGLYEAEYVQGAVQRSVLVGPNGEFHVEELSIRDQPYAEPDE